MAAIIALAVFPSLYDTYSKTASVKSSRSKMHHSLSYVVPRAFQTTSWFEVSASGDTIMSVSSRRAKSRCRA